MIERQEVEGRPATVAYLTKDMRPSDKDDAEMAKILYDDGEIMFVTFRQPESGRSLFEVCVYVTFFTYIFSYQNILS